MFTEIATLNMQSNKIDIKREWKCHAKSVKNWIIPVCIQTVENKNDIACRIVCRDFRRNVEIKLGEKYIESIWNSAVLDVFDICQDSEIVELISRHFRHLDQFNYFRNRLDRRFRLVWVLQLFFVQQTRMRELKGELSMDITTRILWFCSRK